MSKQMTLRGVAMAMALCALAASATYASRAGAQVFERPWHGSGAVVIERPASAVYLDETSRPYVAVPQETIVVAPAVTEHVMIYDDRGMTPADVSRITGNVDSTTAGLPMSGSGAQPGNMGPANSKGQ